MKIIYLNNYHYIRGGSERVLFEEMRMLREGGHEVGIYARSHDKNEASEYAEFFPPPLDTERLPLKFTTLRTVKELIYSNAARKGLREVIKRFRPDVAHAHNIYGRLSLSVLDELKAAGVPVVMTLHDLKLLCPSYLMLNKGSICERCKKQKFYHAVLTRCHKRSYAASLIYALESWINYAFGKYKSVSMFIAPSRFLRDKCIAYGVDRARIIFIPNFINDLSVPQTAVGDYLLYMGRLSREKGVATLIRACSRLSGFISLKIVGDGPMRQVLEREVHDAGLPISFTGYLKDNALEDALSRARAMVLPSEWYENAPMSILEAFAYGKPVIGSNIGGIAEIIDDGINGYLFEAGNTRDLAEKINLLFSKGKNDISQMGMLARKTVEEKFSAETHYQKLMSLYNKVLSEKD
jgi:glycosyltransferase involved in cell wall biosynthesis